MFDSSLRAGRYALENMGYSEYEANETEQAFYQHDRHALLELAKLWDPDVPLADNEAYVARARDLNKDLETALLRHETGEDINDAGGDADPEPAPRGLG
jgi:CPA2 family monovalent cation:H+ antiporter-2